MVQLSNCQLGFKYADKSLRAQSETVREVDGTLQGSLSGFKGERMRLLKNKQVVQLSRAETRAELRERCQKNFPVLLRIHERRLRPQPEQKMNNRHANDI